MKVRLDYSLTFDVIDKSLTEKEIKNIIKEKLNLALLEKLADKKPAKSVEGEEGDGK